MSGTSGVRLESVSKHYGRRDRTVRAVDGISLNVAAGSTLAVTGPSGCGKSTLVALIGGLELPSAGRVMFGAHTVSSLSDRRRAQLRRAEFGFVFQSDNLLPFLTVAENVRLQVALHGSPDGGGRAIELLDAVGLASLADRLPDALSGGQRQRVAVARALVHTPRILIADEPTGSLDPVSAALVIDVLLAAARTGGTTLVIVTHDPSVARRMDRAIGLRDGRLVSDTTHPTAPRRAVCGTTCEK